MSNFLGGSDMARTAFIRLFVLLLVAFQIPPIGHLRAQVPVTAGHEHLTEVACVDVRPGEKRPEFGCFNIATVTGLHFSQASVYWHLRAFSSRKAAEAAKSPTGMVVEEDGRVWLSEFGPRNTAPRGGSAIAIVGPLQLPPAKSYAAVLSYAVMRPGDNSRVHTHPGPEAGTCWRENSVWKLRLAPTGLGPEEPRQCDRMFRWNSTSLVPRFGVRSPWSSMMRLRRGAYPLTGNRPEPVVGNDRSNRLSEVRLTEGERPVDDPIGSSQLPHHRHSRIGQIGAVGTGPNSTIEMLAERGVLLADPQQALADRPGDCASGAFGRRPARRSRPPSPTARASSRTRHSRSASAWAPRRHRHRPRFLDVFFDLGEPPAIRLFGARIEQLAGISRITNQAGSSGIARHVEPSFSGGARSSTWSSRPGSARRRARYCRPFESRRRAVRPSNPIDQ